MVGNFSIFIKFRGDERAQVFKLPGEVVVFSIGEVYVVSFFLFSFLSSLVSLREGEVHCLSFGSVFIVTYMHCQSKFSELL